MSAIARLMTKYMTLRKQKPRFFIKINIVTTLIITMATDSTILTESQVMHSAEEKSILKSLVGALRIDLYLALWRKIKILCRIFLYCYKSINSSYKC